MATTPMPDPDPETPLDQAQRWMVSTVAVVSPTSPRGRRGLLNLLCIIEGGAITIGSTSPLSVFAVAILVAIILLIPRDAPVPMQPPRAKP